ncbi:MAG: hypothetical protein ACPGXZ_00780 [Saprospiraceae bacterium]
MKLIKLILENIEAFIAILTMLSSLFYRMIDWFKHRKMDNIEILLNRQSETFSLLDELQEKINCDRVALLAAHNGNKRIDIETVNMLYSSVISSVKNGKIRDIKKIWKNQPIDKAYTELLKQLSEVKLIRKEVSDLPACLQKTFLEEDGISVFYFVEIKVIEKNKYHKIVSSKKEIYKYVYMSCHFKDLVINDSSIGENIRLSAAKIKELV